jgi:hypothetical protein
MGVAVLEAGEAAELSDGPVCAQAAKGPARASSRIKRVAEFIA